MHDCSTCHRHADRHPDLFQLLNRDQQTNLQIQICDSREGGSCPGDPFSNWEVPDAA